ncbi:TonB family protein [bacterium]|nr:TonB family protein [bacterium]
MKNFILVSALLHLMVAGAGYRFCQRPVAWRHRPYTVPVRLVAAARRAAPEAPVAAETTKPAERPDLSKPAVVEKTREKKPEAPAGPAAGSEKKDASAGGPRLLVDGPVFPYSYYLDVLQRRIQDNWTPPFQKSDDESGSNATVRFRILRDGRITDVQTEKSAGRFLFDQAALRAVLNAGRMPDLPREFSGNDLVIHVEFETP